MPETVGLTPRWAPGQKDPPQFLWCEFSLYVEASVKGGVPSTSHTLTIAVADDTCSGVGVASLRSSGIWMIRVSDGRWRPVYDNTASYRKISRIPRSLTESTPERQVATLLLSPSRLSQYRYATAADAVIGEVIGLAGWTETIRTLSEIYRDSDRNLQNEICFLVSHYGICSRCAATAAGSLPGSSPKNWYPERPDEERTRIRRELALLKVNSYGQLAEHFNHLTPDKIADELSVYACSSAASVRGAARLVLKRYFRMRPVVHCIPCEVANAADQRR